MFCDATFSNRSFIEETTKCLFRTSFKSTHRHAALWLDEERGILFVLMPGITVLVYHVMYVDMEFQSDVHEVSCLY